MNKLKKEEVLNFNTDFLEIYGTFKGLDEKLIGVDGDNSNTIEYLGFSLEKTTNIKNFLYKVSFKKNNVTTFAYYKGKKVSKNIITHDYFVVYGLGFKAFSNEEIYNFINENIDENSINAFKLKRIDLAIDIKRNLSKGILNNFNQLNQKGANFYGSDGEIETHYIGEKKGGLNKRLLIRLYNKLADIKAKSLQRYYNEYLQEKDITRIELEFRSELSKKIPLEKILDNKYLSNLMFKYLKKHTDIFKDLKTMELKKLSPDSKKIDFNELRLDHIAKEKYLSSFLGYSEGILRIGLCPVNILISKGYISQFTIKKIKKIGLHFNVFNYRHSKHFSNFIDNGNTSK